MIFLLSARTPWSQAAPAASPRPPGAAVSPELAASIGAAMNWLHKTQKPDGTWQSKYADQYSGGTEALVLLAGASAGQKADQGALKAALEHVKRLGPDTVYVRAVRALAYARLRTPETLARLSADVAWLMDQQQRNGGWGYGPAHKQTRSWPDWTDGSNSQLAVLALAEAAQAGMNVPQTVWKKAINYWTKSQNADGGWGYDPPRASGPQHLPASYGSMTAAGLASLNLLIDAVQASEGAGKDMTAELAAADKAAGWLARNYKIKENPDWPLGQGEHLNYYLHCLARAAGSSGMRTIAGQDWRRQIIDFVVSQQRHDGSWGPLDGVASGEDQAPVRTALAVLALLEAGKPLLLSKLDLDGSASADNRDAAELARRYELATSQLAAWQTIKSDDPPEAFAAAPVVYVTGWPQQPLPDSLARGLKALSEAGGIVVVAASSQQGTLARDWFMARSKRYRAEACPADHPAFWAKSAIAPADRPNAIAIGDSLRTVAIVLEGTDDWRLDAGKARLPEMLGNLACCSVNGGLLSDWSGRPAKPAATRGKPRAFIRVARVVHDGEWDICPQALDSLSGALIQAVSIGLEQAKPVDLGTEAPKDVNLLWLTGGQGLSLTPAQLAQLKSYVESGGTVFIDSAGGKEAFFTAVGGLLAQAFGPNAFQPVPANHPLMTGGFGGGVGCDLRKIRPTDQPGKPWLWHVSASGRPAVIVSSYGVTCPLEGPVPFGCRALEADNALKLAANVALYSAADARQRNTSAAQSLPAAISTKPHQPSTTTQADEQDQPTVPDDGNQKVRLNDFKFPVPQ